MATGALANLVEAEWGDTELLVVDLPPGTGDVQLSLIQRSRPAGAVIVSTPQDLSLIDARRAVDLFRKTSVPVLGIIENMATYVCPHCGEESHPFGSGGAEAAAAEMGVPFLGRLPLSLEHPRGVGCGNSASRFGTGPRPRHSPRSRANCSRRWKHRFIEPLSRHAAHPRRGHCRATDQCAHDRHDRRFGPAQSAFLRGDEVPPGLGLSSFPGEPADHGRACAWRVCLARARADRRPDRHRRHLPPARSGRQKR